jgi:hypothetical protein
MNRHFRNFVAVLAAGGALGLPLSASRVAAADRFPGPEPRDVSGPTSQHANNLVNQHVDARVNATGERPRDTDDLTVPRRDERRDEQRDPQRDWRNAPGMDRFGWTTTGVPHWAPR